MITVQTTGNFMLIDILNGQEIPYDGTAEVVKTRFIENALEDGRLEQIGGEEEAQPEPEPTPDAPSSGRKSTSKTTK